MLPKTKNLKYGGGLLELGSGQKLGRTMGMAL
jgi:hypothetical protein